MANCIDTYESACFRVRLIDRVLSLVGKRYHGGGGGTGKFSAATCTLTVYHQESDGARNYHEVDCTDPAIKEALNAAALELAPQIAARAREILEQKRTKAASDAAELCRRVLADAAETANAACPSGRKE